ncbi:hypothetical protein RR46_02026 [Papilio xuthus]|uniref:Uncharacterized protein n=1 Tax=Papilio xuthus TaxID=66420 RepID=A0A194QP62_PAPXU|nr:hypothetical protein RR46_02026 [Papilio xuthus]
MKWFPVAFCIRLLRSYLDFKAAIASADWLPSRVYGYTAISRSPEPRLLSGRGHRGGQMW